MSYCLDRDIGNTNTKWRCGDDQGTLASPLIPEVAQTIGRVRIATVAGSREEITECVVSMYDLEPEFVETRAFLCGVRNAYSNPSQLGVDRWLGIVAAWNSCRSACVVVDAGTALTIDVIDLEGTHLGGYIVPGLRAMRHSLSDKTRDVKVGDAQLSDLKIDYPKNTVDAVRYGIEKMARGLVQDCQKRWTTQLYVLVSGGEGQYLVLDDDTYLWRPHLVLDGIELALP